MSEEFSRFVQLHIHQESLHFSCAHFTIFSATDREALHGHNYVVRATVEAAIDDQGLCFDYNKLKQLLRRHCDVLDERTLIAAQSPHLTIEIVDGAVSIKFANDHLILPERDVRLIDVRNVTVEELTRWFLETLTLDQTFQDLPIQSMSLSIASGPSESASMTWSKSP